MVTTRQSTTARHVFGLTTDFRSIEPIGKAKLITEAGDETAFLYFAWRSSGKWKLKPALCLVTMPRSPEDGPLTFYKFQIRDICELEESITFSRYGAKKEAFALRITTRYQHSGDIVSGTTMGHEEIFPRREFLSTHTNVYAAMHGILHTKLHQLKVKLSPTTYDALLDSLDATLNEIGHRISAPRRKPTLAETIISPGTDLKFNEIRVEDSPSRPLVIKASYGKHQLEVRFGAGGRWAKISQTNSSNGSKLDLQFGKRIDSKPGFMVGVSDNNKNRGSKKISPADFVRFMEPLIEQLADHAAKTKMAYAEESALEGIIEANRLTGAREAGSANRR